MSNKEASIFLLFLILPDSIPTSLIYFIQFYTIPILLYISCGILYQFYTLYSIFNQIRKFINAIFPMHWNSYYFDNCIHFMNKHYLEYQ